MRFKLVVYKEMSKAFYLQCKENLCNFVNQLQPCNVAFLFFYANDDKPCIVCTTRKFSLNNNNYYVVQGMQTNFCYFYSDKNIKFLVKHCQLLKNAPAQIYSVNIVSEDYDGPDSVDSVFLGNHLDFSVQISKKSGPFFKIHYTEYEARGDSTLFNRNVNECNIDIDHDAIMGNLDHFKKLPCFHNKDISIGLAFANKTKYRLDLVQHIAQVAVAKQDEQPKQHAGTPFTIPMKKYKNIGIGHPEFHMFIKVHLLDPIAAINWEYESAQMIAQVDHSFIFLWIHFTNWTAKLITLNAHQMFKATFAHANEQRASKKELKCLKRATNAFSKLINAM